MQIAQTAKGDARHVRCFGIEPQVALCSQSQFENLNSETGKKMRQVLDVLDTEKVTFTHEGEINIDTALDPDLRAKLMLENFLKGAANVLIFANADAASGVRNILKMRAGGLEVGPTLMA